jgi:hypothetical protein
MQRREAKNRPERPQGSPETERVERYRRKSPQKRPIGSRRRDLRFRRTGWWGWYGPNCQLPTQSLNRSLTSSQERKFSMQRRQAELAIFVVNMRPETAHIKEFGRHVFEIAALSRASPKRYNLRVWVVGATGIEPVTPSMSTRCSPAELRALRP